MGADLTLMPLWRPTAWFSHTHIELDRRRDLWDAFVMDKARPVTEQFRCFRARLPSGDSGYGVLAETPYGDPLTWMPAGEIAALSMHEDVQSSDKNLAAWAYLSALPEEWPVVLYWH